jgi:hypothetical protein
MFAWGPSTGLTTVEEIRAFAEWAAQLLSHLITSWDQN